MQIRHSGNPPHHNGTCVTTTTREPPRSLRRGSHNVGWSGGLEIHSSSVADCKSATTCTFEPNKYHENPRPMDVNSSLTYSHHFRLPDFISREQECQAQLFMSCTLYRLHAVVCIVLPVHIYTFFSIWQLFGFMCSPNLWGCRAAVGPTVRQDIDRCSSRVALPKHE